MSSNRLAPTKDDVVNSLMLAENAVKAVLDVWPKADEFGVILTALVDVRSRLSAYGIRQPIPVTGTIGGAA